MRPVLAKLNPQAAARYGKRGLRDDRWHSPLAGLALLLHLNDTAGPSFADLLNALAGVAA